MTSFTEEQRLVLDAPQSTVFVAAGAGSGKTSLLVERYVRAAIDQAVPSELLPTVTFTRKAAAELKDRIRQAMLGRGRPDLAWSLESAPIGTIHSLCARLLRENTLEAGLDPEFGLLDEDASFLLRAEVWRDVWARAVGEAGPAELDLMARFRGELEGQLVSVYDRLRGGGEGSPRFRVEGPADLQPAKETLGRVLDRVCAEAAQFDSKTAMRNTELLLECRAWLPGSADTLLSLSRTLRYFPAMNCAAQAKPLFAEARQALESYRRVLAAHCLVPLARTVDLLLQQFHRAYEQRKAEAGMLDFADLELHTVRLLEAGLVPFAPEARLMVDEFQDTNALQCRLIDRLGAGTLLTVGDYHQSIYAFRGADPHVFLQRRSRCDETGDDRAAVLPLATTFRSRGPVVDVVNHLFADERLFGADFPRLRAHRGAEGPRRGRDSADPTLGPAMEILLLAEPAEEDDASDRELEARGVAQRIRRLIDEDGWRPGDVVVLLRSFTHVERFEDALEQAGVPAYVVGGRGYYAREEVTDLLALLRVLVNPHDDLALLTVLRSPLVGCSDDLLYLLHRQLLADEEEFLWETVRRGRVEGAGSPERLTLSRFRERLESLRTSLGRPGLADLIERCLETFDYDLVVLSAPSGKRRFANLRKLQLFAAAFEAVEGPDLRRFVTHVSHRGDLAAQEGSAAVLAENEDVVRIMTIHKAKGLEFPVVVLAGLGLARKKGSSSLFLVGREGDVGVVLPSSFVKKDEERLGLGPISRLREQAAAEEAEEEKRLAYVAITRAEERVIVTGLPSRNDGGDDPLACILAAAGVGEGWRAGPLVPVPGLDLVVDSLPRLEAVEREEGRSPQGDVTFGAPAPPPPAFLQPVHGRAVGGPMSFSSLHLYEQCPRRYYLERVLGLHLPAGTSAASETDMSVLARGGTDEPDGRALGSLVHAALEVADLQGRPDRDGLDRLLAAGAAATGGFADGAKPFFREAAPLVAAFWDSPLVSDPRLSRAAREVPFSFAHGDVLLTGYFDLLLCGDEEWRIVDYKTNRLDGLSREEVLASYGLQAKVYALAALLAGAGRVMVSFLLLRDPSRTTDLVFDEADLPELLRALDGALAGLQAGRYPAVEGAACQSCEQDELCRLLVATASGVV